MKCKNSIMLIVTIAYSICSTVGLVSRYTGPSTSELIRPKKYPHLTVQEGNNSTAEFVAFVKCDSECQLTWYNQHSQDILEETSFFEQNKYVITRNGEESKLKINYIKKNDFGIYQLVVCNSYFKMIQNFNLEVTANPTISSLVHMITNYKDPVRVGDHIFITCAILLKYSHQNIITWEYAKNLRDPGTRIYSSDRILIDWNTNSSHQESTIYIRKAQKNQSGVYTCKANLPNPNELEDDMETFNYTELIVHDEEVPEKLPRTMGTFRNGTCFIKKEKPSTSLFLKVLKSWGEILFAPNPYYRNDDDT